MAQDKSGVRLWVLWAVRAKLTSGLPKPITAPCGSLTQLAARSGTSAGHNPGSPGGTRRRSRAATWVSPMTPKRAAEV